VRNGTKAFVSIVSLGAIAAGYQAGLAAEVQNGFSVAAPVFEQTPAVSPEATSGATPGASSGASSGATPATNSSSAPGKTSAAAPAATPKSSAAAPAPVVAPDPAPHTTGTTHDGAAVHYQYGTVQVAVTKSGGKITAINMLQEGATDGRQAAFSFMTELAIKANGSNFGNLSGATYTVAAFKQSLDSALAKF
jgi:uncharacterized protein with FMN-binding domain